MAFAKAAGCILTNYRWTEKGALSSIKLAEENQIPLSNIYFGIDVWAQNSHTTGPKRITYPAKGGGGTNTGVGVAKLAQLGLSAGVFAPAWSFEHFPGRGTAVEWSLWEGGELRNDIKCDCADDTVHRTAEYQANPITQHARYHPAGAARYFYTDFSRAFAFHADDQMQFYDGKKMHSTLAHQSFHPLRPKAGMPPFLDNRLLSGPPRLLVLHRKHALMAPCHSIRTAKLFDTALSGPFCFEIHYTCYQDRPGDQVSIELAGDSGFSSHIALKTGTIGQRQVCIMPFRHHEPEATVHSISISYNTRNGFKQEETPLLAIEKLALLPTAPSLGDDELLLSPGGIPILECSITNARLIKHEVGDLNQFRLSWDYVDLDAPSQEQQPRQSRRQDQWKAIGMPFSATTGPFAYFDVRVDDLPVQRAYALQHILHTSSVERLEAGRPIDVQIIGVGFNGQSCASKILQIGMPA